MLYAQGSMETMEGRLACQKKAWVVHYCSVLRGGDRRQAVVLINSLKLH